MGLYDFIPPSVSSRVPSPAAVVPFSRLTGSTLNRYQEISAALKAGFPGSQIGGHASGATFNFQIANPAFRSGQPLNLNIPIIGGRTFNKITGAISGHQGAINSIHLGQAQGVQQALIEALRTGQVGHIRGMLGGLAKQSRFTEFEESWNTPYGSMHMLDPWRGQATGYEDTRRMGAEQLFDLAQKNIDQYAAANKGRRLFLDPTKEHALYSGIFSEYDAGHINPFGLLYRGGYKHAQQFKGIPINDVRGRFAHFAENDILGGGRFIRTSFERKLGGETLTSLNMPVRVFFGKGLADKFSSAEQIYFTHEAAEMLGARVGSPIFAGNIKTNVAGIGYLKKFMGMDMSGVSAATYLNPSRISDTLEPLIGGFIQHGISRYGMNRKEILGRLKGAFEQTFDSNFSISNGTSLSVSSFAGKSTRFAKQMFEGLSPDEIQATTKHLIGGLSKAFKIKPGKLFKKIAGGGYYMDASLPVSVREMSRYQARVSLGAGLNLRQGRRISKGLIEIARVRSPKLAAFYEGLIGNNDLKGLRTSRALVRGQYAHLFPSGGPVSLLKGTKALSQSDFGGRMSGLLSIVEEFEQSIQKHGKVGLSGSGATVKKLLDLVPELRGPGFVYNMGAGFPVQGAITGVKGAAAKYGGIVQSLAMTAPLDDPVRAYSMAKVLTGDRSTRNINRLVNRTLQDWKGGKKSLLSRMIHPYVGSTGGIIQTLSPKIDYKIAANTAGRNASMKFVFNEAAEYAFISNSHWNRMMRHPEVAAFVSEHGYIPGLSMRDPQIGQGEIALRMLKDPGSIGLKGRTMVTRAGIPLHQFGDTDFDYLSTILGVGKAHGGFLELEKHQRPVMSYLNKMAEKNINKNGGIGMFRALWGKYTGKTQKAFASLDRYTNKVNYQKELYSAAKVKVLTRDVNPEMIRRLMALDIHDTKDPYTKSISNLLSEDIYAGIGQDAVNKRISGKSWEAIQKLNERINLLASDESLRDEMRQYAYDMTRGAIDGTRGRWPRYRLMKKAKKLLGIDPRAKNIPTVYDPKNKVQVRALDKIIELEQHCAQYGQILKGDVSLDAYNPESLTNSITRGDFGPTTEGQRAALGKAGLLTEGELDIQYATRATEPSLAREGASVLGAASKTFRGVLEKYPAMTLASGALLGAGVLGLGIGVLSKFFHNADQPPPQARVPRTDYMMNEQSIAGMQLSARANLPPDSIRQGQDGSNSVINMSDTRIMDSRSPVSDRVLGYRAEDRLNSLYIRNPVN